MLNKINSKLANIGIRPRGLFSNKFKDVSLTKS